MSSKRFLLFFALALLPLNQAQSAGDALSTPDLVQARRADEFIFSAPPRETPEEAIKTYKPIADYLSRATGKNIVYRWPRTWGLYRAKMLAGEIDLAFDGPHLNGYRLKNLDHHVVAKIAQMRDFSLIVRKDKKIADVQELSGRLVCSQPPPNLGALIVTSQFDASHQPPLIVPTKGWDAVYNGVVSGKCDAGILPSSALAEIDRAGVVNILQRTKPLPDQAFSAGPRFSAQDRAKLSSALLSRDGVLPTERLRSRFQGGDQWVAAKDSEYLEHAALLQQEWGYLNQREEIASK